jgi:Flp pilus assembly protein TadG
MSWGRIRRRHASSSGQSAIEIALLLPLILLIVLNAINLGYFFMVALNVAVAPRTAVQYGAQGGLSATNGNLVALPLAGPSSDNTSISYLAYQDMSRLVGSSTTAVQVCTMTDPNGYNNPGTTSQSTKCTAFGTAASPAFSGAAPDPESPNFALQRVDVQYNVQPLIRGLTFTIAGRSFSLLGPSHSFHRQVSMRAIN